MLLPFVSPCPLTSLSEPVTSSSDQSQRPRARLHTVDGSLDQHLKGDNSVELAIAGGASCSRLKILFFFCSRKDCHSFIVLAPC